MSTPEKRAQHKYAIEAVEEALGGHLTIPAAVVEAVLEMIAEDYPDGFTFRRENGEEWTLTRTR